MVEPSCCAAAAGGDTPIEECCVRHRDPSDGSDLCLCMCEGYGKVCPCAKEVAKRRAIHAVAALYQDSFVFRHCGPELQQQQQTPFSSVRFFRQGELVVGAKLGYGGFCQVHHVRIRDNRVIDGGAETHSGSGLENENQQEYAIKFLRRQTTVDKKLFLQGAVDLAVEASFLSAFCNTTNGCDNKHIIKLHGVAEGRIHAEDGGFEDQILFVIMDQLVETLDHRVYHKWKKEDEGMHHGMFNPLARVSHEFQKRRQEALVVRLNVALEVADAMRYLHSLKVVYRDLKPENFGFDQNGVGKLYDFGLATELKYPLPSGTYNLSGGAGSIRYMAPEVELGIPYDLSVDVYSYGILLYEVAGLHKPFEGYDAAMHMQRAVKNGERPHLPHWFPKELRVLIEACWSEQPSQRPHFNEIVERLGKVVDCLAKNPHTPEAVSVKSYISGLHGVSG